jgi:large subunit ribosomal protein L23
MFSNCSLLKRNDKKKVILIDKIIFQFLKRMTNKNVNLPKWRSILENHWSSVEMNFDVIKYPVITEKTYLAMFKNRQYTFDVALDLTKPQIKMLFEKLFNVNIIAMNTHRPPRQRVRVGMKVGFRPQYKRVIFTLKEGQSIRFENN